MSLLIRNVLCHNKVQNIYIEKDKITHIGNQQPSADQVIDGSDKAALPTLVNGHTHAAMSLLRGYGDDMQLQEWLQTKIWPLEAKLTEDDIYWGTKLACLEMIQTGTTAFCDMYWHPQAAAQAIEEMGMRAVLSTVFLDIFDPSKGVEQRKRAESLVPLFRKNYSSRIQLAMGPHALYTVSTETLRWIGEFAKQEKLLVHFHLSETEKEIKDCIANYRQRPVPYLDSIGFLHPGLIAAHCVWLDDDEIDTLAARKVSIVHDIVSNLKLAVGKIFRYAAIKQRNIQIALGTDGCASNNNLDMFEELKFTALVQKWSNNDATVVPCQEAWDCGTKVGHQIMNIDAGVLAEGKLADLMLVDLNHPQMVPCHNLVSNLVYSANGSVVDTVICDGKILMKNRQVPGATEIIAGARNAVAKLLAR